MPRRRPYEEDGRRSASAAGQARPLPRATQAYVDRITAAMLSMPSELIAELRTIIWDWLGSPPEPLAGAGRGQSRPGEGGYTEVGIDALGLLTVQQAADLLKVSVRTVRRLIAVGELESVRIGSAVRIAPEDLTAFIDTLRNSPPS